MPGSHRGSVGVWVLLLISFVGTLGYRSTIPVASFYARTILGVTALGVGGMTAAFYLLRAVAAVGSGYASTGARRAGLIAAASFAAHVAVVWYLATRPSYSGLLLVRGLQGVLNGFAWTSAQVLLAIAVPTSFRGRAFALYGLAGSVGAMAGDLLYTRMGSSCLWISGAAFALSSLASAALPGFIRGSPSAPEKGAPRGASRGGASRGRLVGPAVLLLLMAAVSYISVMGVGDISYVYFKELLGISKGEASALRGVAGFLGTLAGYGLGWLADVGGSTQALLLAYTASILGALAIPVPSVYVAGLGIALITASGRAFLPTARKVASEYPRGNVYLGYIGAASNVASALGALAYGYAYTRWGLTTIEILGLRLVKAPLIAVLWAVTLPLLALLVSIVRKH